MVLFFIYDKSKLKSKSKCDNANITAIGNINFALKSARVIETLLIKLQYWNAVWPGIPKPSMRHYQNSNRNTI